MRKQILFVASLFLLLNNLSSQFIAVRDSLAELLKTLPNDTNRVLTLNRLAFQYALKRPDSTYLLGQEAYDLSRSLKYLNGEASSLNVMGLACSGVGDEAKAFKMYNQSKELYTQMKNPRGVAVALNNIADMYMRQSEWQKGLDKMRESYATFETIPKEQQRNRQLYLSNIGECFYNLNQLDSAAVYLNRALAMEKLNPQTILTTVLYLLGDVALANNTSSVAYSYYKESAAVSIKDEAYSDLYEVYYRLAKLFEKSNQRDSTLHYAKLALTFAEQSAYSRGVLKSSQYLSSLYQGKNDGEALRFYKIANSARDSLFSQDKVKQMLSLTFEEKEKAQQIAASKLEYANTIRLYVFIGILTVFGVVALFLVRNNRQKQKANYLLAHQKEKVESTLQELKLAQSQLVQSEKMASLGELTAGIAHEIQNPLNFVNNFSEINTELIKELKEEVTNGNLEDVAAIADDIAANSEKINHHGKRADAIVKGMLQHSRSSNGHKEPTDINALCDEYLRLAYHGLRAKDKAFNASLKTDFDPSIGKVDVMPQDIGRVILNLINNAFYAVDERKKASNGQVYEPTVSVATKRINENLEITVSDNGKGIPKKVIDKIFQPFFTTKPTGQGTGLGLSLSYDIVKAHGGDLKVETKEGKGSEFAILLPA